MSLGSSRTCVEKAYIARSIFADYARSSLHRNDADSIRLFTFPSVQRSLMSANQSSVVTIRARRTVRFTEPQPPLSTPRSILALYTGTRSSTFKTLVSDLQEFVSRQKHSCVSQKICQCPTTCRAPNNISAVLQRVQSLSIADWTRFRPQIPYYAYHNHHITDLTGERRPRVVQEPDS
ncbi:uncharacterized protein LY89DRAFT_181397 [Mollisia scopiformis]|uniref:Uncharacterized protein n=1 Tax=Mollisia scopiformis TaxID=149040 RepID=A0A194XTN3_MOLSC|nr:uncharacterized protein LY89DRAFT_181397 [Mollisia scopiformis]KUJ23404.1 hypothetical protein LY89DRAFT_181397 [Mollisia scopiformis]